MEKEIPDLENKKNKLIFDMSYGEYLQKKYPDLYQQGIKMAVEKYHCYPDSITAFLYATSYIKKFLSTAGILELISPKNIH
jgi:hypothetical protein